MSGTKYLADNRVLLRICLTAAFFLMVAVAAVRADFKPNFYDSITNRNAFGLHSPPSPVPPNLPPPPPPAEVRVAGITSVDFKKKALLEIKPALGKPTLRPILEEGGRAEMIEVVAIDVDHNSVLIKNDGVLTNLHLSFEPTKSTTSASATMTVAFNASNPFPTANARRGVTVTGAMTASPTPNSDGGTASSVSGPASVNPNTPTVTGPTIPLRIPREANAVTQPTLDPAQQYINMRATEINSSRGNQSNPRSVPLPPTPPVAGLE